MKRIRAFVSLFLFALIGLGTSVACAAGNPPVNVTQPTIAGSPVQGSKLTQHHGAWTGDAPIRYTFQWQDDATIIPAATQPTYVVAPGDVGHTLSVIVTASNPAGTGTATSAPTAVVTGPTSPCTTTVSDMAALSSAVASAADGSTVCLAAGSYSGMSLGGTHASDITVQPAADPNGAGKVTIGLSSSLTDGFGNHVAADVLPGSTHIAIRNLYFTGELSIAYGSSDITVENNSMTGAADSGGGEMINFGTSNCKAPNAPSWPNCRPLAPVSNVTIKGNDFHDNNQTLAGGDDVLHTNNFQNLTITGNQFRNIVENGAGGHVDCLQNVFGGTGLTFDHNYMHDNECQGFFIKDGDITNVTFVENLFLRDNVPATNGGSSFSLSQAWNTNGLVFQRNTIWDAKGFGLRCLTASVPCTAQIDHNLIALLNNGSTGDATRYALSESFNVFGRNPWTFNHDPSDVVDPGPAFMCAASCGNETVTGDDYRLVTNPNGIGVDWTPAAQTYGPVGP